MSAFDKVIGYAAEKKELQQIADVLAHPEVYRALGVSSPRGLLLSGEPGVGKTLMANCLIEASGRPVFVCRKDKPNGDFIKDIKEKFTQAAESAPAIILLDDLDKFTNGDDRHPDAEEYVTVQSCIDDIKDREVFVLATVNNMRVLPKSLLRAGRFDRHIKVSTPHGADAVKIISHYLKGKTTMDNVDPAYIAKLMDGHSCAAVETVVNEAGALACYERAPAITVRHFVEAFLKQTYDTALPVDDDDDDDDDDEDDDDDAWKRESAYKKAQMEYVACHEVGHALVAEALCPGSVTLVSIRNGGMAAVWDMPGSMLDKRERQVLTALGGMIAVELHFGTVDVGNRSDLERAFEIVRDLMTENAACGLGHVQASYYRPSEQFLDVIERVVAAEMERYCRRVRQILLQHNALFEKMTAALLQKGFLTMADIKEIKEECAAWQSA